MALVMEAVRAVRNLRAEMNVPPARRAPLEVRAEGRDLEALREGSAYLMRLANLESLDFAAAPAAGEKVVAAVAGGAELRLPLAGLVDVDREAARLGRELAAARGDLERVRAKLANAGFLRGAAPEVVAKERRKAEELAARAARLEGRLNELAGRGAGAQETRA